MVKGSFKIGLMIAVLLTLSLSIFFSGVFAGTNNQNIEINNSINIVDIINLNYTVKDTFIYNKKAKEIKFPSIFSNINISEVAIGKKMEAKDCLYLNKTKYFGDAEVKLMEKVNVTKQRINRTWKCNCTNITQKNNQTNLTENKTIEVCQICKEYENYTVEVMREINPENFVLRRGKPIYEVFEGCKKIVKLPNGKWGCSVWTDVYILGQKIKGMTWWNTSWNYRQAINISNTVGDLTKYQVRLDLNSTNVGSNFNWSNNGSDIRFTNSTDDELNFWIEDWNSTGQEAIIWVNVTSLPNNTNTTIYMYYGNSEASSASDVNSTFIRVIDGAQPVKGSWHFDENSGTTAYDTSGNDNDGTITGASWTDGKFDKALSFDGNDDYVDVPDSASLDITGSFSLEAWIIQDSQTSDKAILSKHGTSSSTRTYGLCVSSDTASTPNALMVFFYDSSGNDHTVSETSPIDRTDGWHHIVGVYDGNTLYLYIDGSLVNSQEIGSYTVNTNDNSLRIGGFTGYTTPYLWNGDIDEVRIYKDKALNSTEISDLYNNYGYTTENYPGRVLVRKYADPEPSASFGSEEIIKIEGYVKDTSGNPISGARVNIIKQSTTGKDTLLATVTTDANGYYSYATTEKGNFTICAYINSTTQGDCKPFVEIS